MRLKKRGVILILLFIFLIYASSQIHAKKETWGDPQQATDALKEGDVQGNLEESVKLEEDVAGVRQGSELGPGNMERKGGDIIADNVPKAETTAGTSMNDGKDVTIFGDGSIEAGSVEDLTTKDSIAIGPAQGVIVDSDGNVNADSVDVLNVKGVYGGQNIADFKYDKANNEFSTISGKNIVFYKPYPVLFFEVGESWFKVDENDNLLAWRVQFPYFKTISL